MPKPNYPAGLGPMGIEHGLTPTLLSPADTNSTTKKITAGMPLLIDSLAGADGNLYAILPGADDVPEAIAAITTELPDFPISVRIIGNAVAGSPPAGNVIEKVAYTGSIPSVTAPDYAQVLADGDGAFKLVASTDGTGIGRVLKAAGGTAIVMF